MAVVFHFLSRKFDANLDLNGLDYFLPYNRKIPEIDKFLIDYNFDKQLLEYNKSLKNKFKKFQKRNIVINWFIPNFQSPYGGGINDILKFATFLYKKGIKSNFVITQKIDLSDIKRLKQTIENTFPELEAFRIFDINTKLPSCDIAFATTWQSAYYVLHYNKTKIKFYFIQDYEPLFYPAGSMYAAAENTYRFGFYAVTFGKWLKDMYKNKYKGKAVAFMPCADKIFHANKTLPVKTPRRIFFFARPLGGERRAFEIGMAALSIVKKRHPNLEIILAGFNGLKRYEIPFDAKIMGDLTLEQTAELYRTCDIGLVFSMTNLSLVPIQLMASGCLVISNRGPNVEYLLRDRYNCLLTEMSPTMIADTVEYAINNYELRRQIFNNGIKTANRYNWDNEFNKVYNKSIKKLFRS